MAEENPGPTLQDLSVQMFELCQRIDETEAFFQSEYKVEKASRSTVHEVLQRMANLLRVTASIESE